MRRIGIFGGAFDPVHLGHTGVIRDAMAHSGFHQMILLPNQAPPYSKPLAPMGHVRAMIGIAIQGMEGVSLADRSLSDSAQDTVDMVRGLVKAHGNAQVSYVIGADKLAGLLHWRKAHKLFALCELLVYPRRGDDAQEMVTFANAHGIRARLLPCPPVTTRAALARQRLAQWSDAEGMLAPKVAHYIARYGLYQRPLQAMVKPHLSPDRLAHTLRGRDLAVDLALHHGLPMQKAAAAALLHDCAKGMSLSDLRAIARKHRLTQDTLTLSSNALLHGLVGAVLAREKYGVKDRQVLDAIRYHTTGRARMTGLELCLFVADKAEAGRPDYTGLTDIRALMYRDLRLAALRSMMGTASHVRGKGQPYSPQTQAAIDYLLREVRP